MSATSISTFALHTSAGQPSVPETFDGDKDDVSHKPLTSANKGEFTKDLSGDHGSRISHGSAGAQQTEGEEGQKESIATTVALNKAMAKKMDDLNNTQEDRTLAYGADILRTYTLKLERYGIYKADEGRHWKEEHEGL
jgi:hypothetical protein